MNAPPRPAFILILGAASSTCDKEFELQPYDFKRQGRYRFKGSLDIWPLALSVATV